MRVVTWQTGLLRWAFVTVTLLGLIGCAASGPLYGDPNALKPGSSEIVIYRLDRFARGGVTYLVHLDGKEVAKLQNAGFAVFPVSPGTHELEIRASALQNFKPMKVVVESKAGARSYFRFEPFMSSDPVILPNVIVLPVGYNFIEVPESLARVQLLDLRRSE